MRAKPSIRLLRLAILLAAAALLPLVTAASLRWAAQRQLDQASLATLRDLAARQPDSAPVQHAYAARLLATGDAAAAREPARRAAEREPGVPAHWLLAARAAAAAGDLPAARACLSGARSAGASEAEVEEIGARLHP